MVDYHWYITPKEYDLALNNGISNHVLENRIHEYGWDIKRACTEHLHRQGLKNILTDEIKETLKINNIKIATFSARVLRLGWTTERAMNTHTLTAKESINLAVESIRKISIEQYEVAKNNGIKVTTLQCRVKRGWNPEKASTTPTMTKTEVANSGYFHKLNTLVYTKI